MFTPFPAEMRGQINEQRKRPEEVPHPADHLWISFLELTQDITEHFSVFQADGEENCFQWPGMSHINCFMCMEFGPVEKKMNVI